MEEVSAILQGGVDLHTHAGPELYQRSVDQFELAQQAKADKMAAVVIKNHFCPSFFAAEVVNKNVSGIQVFGGLVLNTYVGGFNVDAVDLAVKAGAKIIWMPTLSAANHISYFGKSEFTAQSTNLSLRQNDKGLTILDRGRLKTEVYNILEVIAASDAILATGHLSRTEVFVLLKEAAKMNIKKILINHADFAVNAFSEDNQREMIKYGAILEKCLLTTMPGWGTHTIEYLASSIRRLGANNCVLVTDFGQSHHVTPIEGLKIFVKGLLQNGISSDEIREMLVSNPCDLLGIS